MLDLSQIRIFLVGMPGAGKTYWSKVLKKKIKIPAYDLDTLVEIKKQKSIEEIFATKSEAYFRRAELEMLRLMESKKSFVLATGGGTPAFYGNMNRMNEAGITIWIDEPLNVLHARIMSDKKQRPLLTTDNTPLISYLEIILGKRKVYYEKAAYKVSGPDITENDFIKIIKQHA